MTIETALQTNQRIAELVENLDEITPLPEVTARITATVNNPDSTAGDLHKIIAHDPALVSRVLKLANSSLYARRFHVDSVQRAIVLLGFEAIHNLAISVTLGQLFSHAVIDSDYTARDLWTHSVAVAAASRALARRIRPAIAEPAFLAGLMHDVGLLVELQVCPQKLAKVCLAAKTTPVPFATIELDQLGCNHAELGAAVAEKWKFPELCRVVAGYHHYPSMAEPEHRQLAAIVYVADTLCCQDTIGFDLTAAHQVADSVASAGLIPLDAVEFIEANLPELVSDAILLFS